MTVQIVERPYLFPARCYFTGDTGEKPIIDTGVNDTNGGRVYMSLDFFDEVLRAVGIPTRLEIANLAGERDQLKAANDKLPAALEGIINGLRAVVDSGLADLLTDGTDAGDPVDAGAKAAPKRAAGGKPRTDSASRESQRPSL